MWNLRGSLESETLVALPNPALDAVAELWMLTATLMVLFMQAGFLLVEAGSVRSKNTINVAQKNVADFIICGCIFLLIGGNLMLGTGTTGWFGFGGLDFSEGQVSGQFVFQFAFCATAATIVSGAVAERMRFSGYMCLTAIMAGIIYPLFAHMVWGNTILPDNPAWLADLGFTDYAGSTVVHVIGGMAALAAILVIGARKGRFDSDGKPVLVRGHSTVLTTVGVMILMIGWIGFNAGAAKPGSSAFSLIILNTVTAMSFGGAVGFLYGIWRTPGKTHPKSIMTAILGGLVAITAGCAFVTPYGAAFIGASGALVAIIGAHVLLHRFKLDDPVDAVAIHAGAGLWGTAVLPFFAYADALPGGLLQQVAVQLFGTTLAAIWAFSITYAALKLVSRWLSLRVSHEEEDIGLNLVEHDDGFNSHTARALIAEGKNQKNADNRTGGDFDDQASSLSLIVQQARASKNEVERAQETIEDLATRDQLTGLCNRAAFEAILEEDINSNGISYRHFTILFMDLDGFKAVNDSFGHASGDKVLKIVSQRLLEVCGPDAVLARFGGDEFCIQLPGSRSNDETSWQATCHAIVQAVAEKILINNSEVHIGGSIGVAHFPNDSRTLDKLLSRADMALYVAKAHGKGRWVSFVPDMEERAVRRSELESDMRSGLNDDQFSFLYQPQLSIETGRVKGFEALMRWNHPKLGQISPEEFIPIAEETGLIIPITNHLLADACRLATHWPSLEDEPCKLCVNISAVHLNHSDLITTLTTNLEEAGLDPSALEVEITESVLIGDKQKTWALFAEIRALGIDIAVDDFGTGYSSLSYLQELPVTRLKIDRAFITDVESNPNSQRITKTIVDLGKSLGLEVIAEGVETPGQQAFLSAIECDDVQGFLYSAPVPALETMSLLAKRFMPPRDVETDDADVA